MCVTWHSFCKNELFPAAGFLQTFCCENWSHSWSSLIGWCGCWSYPSSHLVRDNTDQILIFIVQSMFLCSGGLSSSFSSSSARLMSSSATTPHCCLFLHHVRACQQPLLATVHMMDEIISNPPPPPSILSHALSFPSFPPPARLWYHHEVGHRKPFSIRAGRKKQKPPNWLSCLRVFSQIPKLDFKWRGGGGGGGRVRKDVKTKRKSHSVWLPVSEFCDEENHLTSRTKAERMFYSPGYF